MGKGRKADGDCGGRGQKGRVRLCPSFSLTYLGQLYAAEEEVDTVGTVLPLLPSTGKPTIPIERRTA